MLGHFYESLGISFPRDFEGITEENYADLWKKDQGKAREIFARFLSTLGESIDPAFARRGDLMIFRGKKLPTFPAIYLGNGIIRTVFDQGVRSIPFEMMRPALIEVRRLIQ